MDVPPRAVAAGGALLCLAVALFLFPPRIDGAINPQDDGIWLAAAQCAAEGKTLYKDVAYHFGPLLYAPLRAALTRETATLSRARKVFWVENLLGLWIVLLALWRLSSSAAVRAPFLLFLGLVPFAAHTMTIPYAARYGAGFLPLLLWPRGAAPEPRRAFLIGFLGGAAYWVSQEAGAAAVLAGAFLHWRRDGFRRSFLAHAAGAAAALGAGLLVISFFAGLHDYAVSSVTDIGRLVFRLRRPFPVWRPELLAQALEGRGSWGYAWLNTADAVAGRFPVLLCLATLWPASLRRLEGEADRGAALAVYGLAAALSAWARSDRWHVYFALSPALVLAALWTERLFQARGRRGAACLLGALALGTLLTFPAYFERRSRDAAVAMVSRTVDISRGGTARIPTGQAAGYELLAAEVNRRAPPGTPFFYYPFNGAAYFMTGRSNPTRWPLPVDALRPDQQESMVRQLQAADVRWVVKDRHITAFDGVPIENLLPTLDKYLAEAYVPRGDAGPFVFLEKKAGP